MWAKTRSVCLFWLFFSFVYLCGFLCFLFVCLCFCIWWRCLLAHRLNTLAIDPPRRRRTVVGTHCEFHLCVNKFWLALAGRRRRRRIGGGQGGTAHRHWTRSLCAAPSYNVCPAHNVWSAHTDKYIKQIRQIHFRIETNTFMHYYLHCTACCIPPLKLLFVSPPCHVCIFCTTLHILHTSIALVAICVQCTVSPAHCLETLSLILLSILCNASSSSASKVPDFLFACLFSSLRICALYWTPTTPSEKFLHILFVLFHFVLCN